MKQAAFHGYSHQNGEIAIQFLLGLMLQPVSLGGRAVGWVEAEITKWLNQQIEASRKAAN